MYAYFGTEHFFVAGVRAFDSNNKEFKAERGILAVVVLDSNVTFEKSENNAWNLKK